MQNYEEHGKTRGNASDGIKSEKEACTLGWSGSHLPSDPLLILLCSALYPPGLKPDFSGPTSSGASGGVWTAAGIQGDRTVGGGERPGHFPPLPLPWAL